MHIAMFTNTYLPHVGGVARSTSTLVGGLRATGHEVLVVAPSVDGAPDDDPYVVRVPAMQNFSSSDFAAPLPLSASLGEDLAQFEPDIVHSHHPFLLGDTALRVTAARKLPIVFTYHTRYELYGHYVARDTDFMRRTIRSLCAGYCNLCDAVIAPSRSIAVQILADGVTAPTRIIPSGIDPEAFAGGDGARLREVLAIPAEAFVVGHVGRLAPEKNLDHLVDALAELLLRHPLAYVVVAGDGPSREPMMTRLEEAGVGAQARFPGTVRGETLADIYAASDVFAFTSHSETQGLVLAEAMTAGTPVVALDAPGVREIVRDGINGRLLPANTDAIAFADVLDHLLRLAPKIRDRLGDAAQRTAERFTMEDSVLRTLELYRDVIAAGPGERDLAHEGWSPARRIIAEELEIIGNVARAVGSALRG